MCDTVIDIIESLPSSERADFVRGILSLPVLDGLDLCSSLLEQDVHDRFLGVTDDEIFDKYIETQTILEEIENDIAEDYDED